MCYLGGAAATTRLLLHLLTPACLSQNFYNPITKTFTVPRSGGISYSFTDDGFFETSTYRFESNRECSLKRAQLVARVLTLAPNAAANNRCFKASLTWQHGTYTFNANNSISLTPYAADGLVQVMDPCAAVSVAKYNYNQ